VNLLSAESAARCSPAAAGAAPEVFVCFVLPVRARAQAQHVSVSVTKNGLHRCHVAGGQHVRRCGRLLPPSHMIAGCRRDR
jgi:hypothetical protein